MAQLLSGDGKMITDYEEKAEVLNSYFTPDFSQRTDYDSPNKCEVQVEGTRLQLEINKQIFKDYSLP